MAGYSRAQRCLGRPHLATLAALVQSHAGRQAFTRSHQGPGVTSVGRMGAHWTTVTMALLCGVAVLCAPCTDAQPTPAPASEAAGITDADILNFALNLEYLEANYYSFATTGKPIAANYTGGGPPAEGGIVVSFSDPSVQAIANNIASDELHHVIFLRAALGPAAVAQPAIDLGSAWGALGDALGFGVLNPPFTPYENDITFLLGAFIFEDVGVTAYKGAAPAITSKTYLSPAAGILAVEAYHAGAIRTLLFLNRTEIVLPYNLPVLTLVTAESNLRAKLDSGKDSSIVLFGNANIAPTDSNSIAWSRTPQEVLPIVYGGGKGSGAFFPNGLNGAIK